jgi:hypothetical protein
MSRTDRELREIVEELHEESRLLREENKILRQIRDGKKLSYIKLVTGGIMPVGPQTFTIGDKKVLSVKGFDQFGADFAIDFTANPVTFTDDNEAVLQDTAGSTVTDPVTALAAGVANVTAACGGKTDTEAYTVLAEAPKLAGIKLSAD